MWETRQVVCDEEVFCRGLEGAESVEKQDSDQWKKLDPEAVWSSVYPSLIWWPTNAATVLLQRISRFSFRCQECERETCWFCFNKEYYERCFRAPQSGDLLVVLVSMQSLQVWGAASKSSFCLPDESYLKHSRYPNYVFMCLQKFSE